MGVANAAAMEKAYFKRGENNQQQDAHSQSSVSQLRYSSPLKQLAIICCFPSTLGDMLFCSLRVCVILTIDWKRDIQRHAVG